MCRRHSPAQQFREAQCIARDAGLFIVERRPAPGDLQFAVYRKTAARPIFLGRRRSAEGLRAFVARLARFQ